MCTVFTNLAGLVYGPQGEREGGREHASVKNFISKDGCKMKV